MTTTDLEKAEATLADLDATIVAILAIAAFLGLFGDSPDLKTSEVHLTCAAIIGGALALILSLSIIPAQRAAETFSPAILQLYAQDRWLVIAFLALVTAATGSVLLGTNFMPSLDARIPIGIQFLLLGISFDALRMFYKRAHPIFELQRIMKVAASRTSPDPPGTAETRQPN
jgi:hypothetical protein